LFKAAGVVDKLPYFVYTHYIGQLKAFSGVELGRQVIGTLENMFVVKGHTGCDHSAFVMTTVKDLFDVADILFYLFSSNGSRVGIGIILKDEAKLPDIITNAPGRILSNGHDLLKFK
jgi:hypothetical protein